MRTGGDAPWLYPWPLQMANQNPSPGARKPDMPRDKSGRAGPMPAGPKGLLAQEQTWIPSVSPLAPLPTSAMGRRLRQNNAHQWSCGAGKTSLPQEHPEWSWNTGEGLGTVGERIVEGMQVLSKRAMGKGPPPAMMSRRLGDACPHLQVPWTTEGDASNLAGAWPFSLGGIRIVDNVTSALCFAAIKTEGTGVNLT